MLDQGSWDRSNCTRSTQGIRRMQSESARESSKSYHRRSALCGLRNARYALGFPACAFHLVMTAFAPIAPSSTPALMVQVRAEPMSAGTWAESRFRLRVDLKNASSHSLLLLSRCWRLIDADHRVAELRGPCVSGQRPELQPATTYTFACEVQLASDWGSLEGAFRVLDETGALHEIEMERQVLARPVLA